MVELAGTDPNRCAVLCANLGGDTDTIGAMATAICGALHGVQAIDPALKNELDAVNRLDFGHYCEKLLHFREQRGGRMSAFARRLETLHATRPVTVLGAAVIDVIADAYALPWRGCDIELKQQGVNIGGCALNIAIALKRLGIAAQNALPVGHGVWADIIRNAMAKQDLHSAVEAETGDNGWCLALVEPDGERTFMSFSGVENQWQQRWLDGLSVPGREPDLFVRLPAGVPSGELLTAWLESLQDATLFIDFGPRIADIPDPLMASGLWPANRWSRLIVRRRNLPQNGLA